MERLLFQWIATAVIGFILRQVSQFKDKTDWDKVLDDAIVRVKALVPGDFLDAEAARVVTMLILGAQKALSQEKSLKIILDHIADENWIEALQAFKNYLIKAFAGEEFRTQIVEEGGENYLQAARLLVERYEPMA